MKPKILVLDEPAAGVDPRGRNEILEAIKKMHDETGITVIMVSHSMEDVAKYANRILVMDKGKLAMEGTPKEIFSKVDELEKIGLAAPEVSYIMRGISKKFDVPSDIFTVEEAVDAIYKMLKGDSR
jgi:energy-coupling factor transport system ATP-binding protein